MSAILDNMKRSSGDCVRMIDFCWVVFGTERLKKLCGPFCLVLGSSSLKIKDKLGRQFVVFAVDVYLTHWLGAMPFIYCCSSESRIECANSYDIVKKKGTVDCEPNRTEG